MTEAQKHREYVISALSELKSDTEHIKEGVARNEQHLVRLMAGYARRKRKSSLWKGLALFSLLFLLLLSVGCLGDR